jgi:competence CoiA-like predicted nuclease
VNKEAIKKLSRKLDSADLFEILKVLQTEADRRIETVKKNNELFRKSDKQKRYYKLQSDRMQTVKHDMIEHIHYQIDCGYYTPTEFVADPGVYLDSQIMGAYIKNKILVKSIVKAVEDSYITDLMF